LYKTDSSSPALKSD